MNSNEKKLKKYKKKLYISRIILIPIMLLTVYTFIDLSYSSGFDIALMPIIFIIGSLPFTVYLMLTSDYKNRILILEWKYKYKNEDEKIFFEQTGDFKNIKNVLWKK